MIRLIPVSSGLDVFHDDARIGQLCVRFDSVFFVDLGGNAAGPWLSAGVAREAIERAAQRFAEEVRT